MKDTNTIDGAGRNGVSAINGASRIQPVATEEKLPEDIDTARDAFDEEETEETLKPRFQSALIGACKAEASLAAVMAEMVAADVTRDDAIDWGIETGLSESYVRSTVSRIYIELTGRRVVAKGAGRKVNKGAKALAERVLKETDGDFAKAKALLLAARRILERMEKAADKAKSTAAAKK